ncbi:MAG: murein hydrolase activator EnvC family protein [Solidesulfovibrio sp. DCME]|uniref:murein hydrolase activator EnvC family protein n=1 Tax=Solidesulfovibrio sp. DCME TaxID=3447380 RepID=UPI003D0CBA52
MAFFLAAALCQAALPAASRLAVAAKRPEARAAGMREADRSRLSTLLASLWMRLAGGDGGTERDWAEGDRRRTWTRRLLEALAGPGEGADAAARAGGNTPEPRRDAARSPREPGREVASREVRGLRPVPLTVPEGEADLEPKEFVAPTGGLAWPSPGRLAAGFAPSANPPRQGVVLAVAEGSPVVAAADGQVVFTGALRGLGRIVILDHGTRRHTVYGCLGQVGVGEGDLVARGEVLGRAGFCGPAKANGVYFELRFREKALNPAEWLAARR